MIIDEKYLNDQINIEFTVKEYWFNCWNGYDYNIDYIIYKKHQERYELFQELLILIIDKKDIEDVFLESVIL